MKKDSNFKYEEVANLRNEGASVQEMKKEAARIGSYQTVELQKNVDSVHSTLKSAKDQSIANKNNIELINKENDIYNNMKPSDLEREVKAYAAKDYVKEIMEDDAPVKEKIRKLNVKNVPIIIIRRIVGLSEESVHRALGSSSWER